MWEGCLWIGVHPFRHKNNNVKIDAMSSQEKMGGITVSAFGDREAECERFFEEMGPFWHVYTDGTKMENVFCQDEDMKMAMIALAVEEKLQTEVMLVAFEIMQNHVHLIMAGNRDGCLNFFKKYKQRLMRMFPPSLRYIDWTRFESSIIQIDSLKSLRNEIIYAHRNAFVANPEFTPCNYPWGSGWAYFNTMLSHLSVTPLSEFGVLKQREMVKCRDVSHLGSIKFMGSVPFIPSFCRIDIGERMFRDPRCYFYALTRNAETLSQIAMRMKDEIFLTDDEMYSVAVQYSQSMFSVAKLNLLPPGQKIELAKELRLRFKATQQQLRRILRLDMKVISELFP